MYKVLIADDEPLALSGIQMMLSQSQIGVTVTAAARNGAQALEAIEREMPDIVITDIKMPVVSGLELARECAERYENGPIFIMLTSYDDFELVRAALRERAADYIIKAELTETTLKDAIAKAIDALSQRPTAPAPCSAGLPVGRKERVISDVKRYIHENYTGTLSLSKVASAFNFNPSYLSHLFSKCTGESVVDYITSLRVAEAKRLLAENDISIADIAERVGFENQFYFSRVFKRVTGVSPRDYVRENQRR